MCKNCYRVFRGRAICWGKGSRVCSWSGFGRNKCEKNIGEGTEKTVCVSVWAYFLGNFNKLD